MTNASGLAHTISLRPLDGVEPQPLRRWMGRESWLRRPVAAVRHDREHDRVLLRFVGAPTTAEGALRPAYDEDADVGLFIGFDGSDSHAWPTTIALLDFSRHRDGGSRPADVVREIVGPHVWAAMARLARDPHGEQEILIPPAEASRLVSRWQELILPHGDVDLSDEILDEVLAEWSTTVTLQLVRASATGKTLRRRVVVDGDDLFRQLTGRSRRPLEPWPSARVDFDPKGNDYLISVVLPVPQLRAGSLVVSAQLIVGDLAWGLILEPESEQSSQLTTVLIGCRLVDVNSIPLEFVQGGVTDVRLILRVTATDPGLSDG